MGLENLPGFIFSRRNLNNERYTDGAVLKKNSKRKLQVRNMFNKRNTASWGLRFGDIKEQAST